MTDQSHNEYDRSIVNQPEIEYRKEKFPFVVKNQRQDVQPVKRGNWKQDASGELYCPYCMYIPQWDDDKYCANCGAKMDGGDADET